MSTPDDSVGDPRESADAKAAKQGWTFSDLHAWEVLRPLLDAGPYLPWSEGALRPGAVVKIANEIVLGRRHTVVELGSGIGTIVIARLLCEYGGELTSVEHEPSWARFVVEQIEREELTDNARVLEAPLEAHAASLAGAPWYSEAALAGLPDAIEMLIVDGPPGYGEGMELSRYPALPALRERLAPGALVVLDDANRPGEQQIVERWRAETGLEFGLMRSEGIAIAEVPGAA
ncbi:hypothetical protein BH10ACT11_BH10ACT11_05730 [soil metagenome]